MFLGRVGQRLGAVGRADREDQVSTLQRSLGVVPGVSDAGLAVQVAGAAQLSKLGDVSDGTRDLRSRIHGDLVASRGPVEGHRASTVTRSQHGNLHGLTLSTINDK